MKAVFVLSVIIFAAAFGAVYSVNSFTGYDVFFKPPYHYAAGGLPSEANAFAFAFIFSLLFFGYSAPIALGIEGLKYASLYSSGIIGLPALAFILPQFVACFAAMTLGEGAIKDYKGEGKMIDYAWKAFKYLAVAIVLFVAVFAANYFLV